MTLKESYLALASTSTDGVSDAVPPSYEDSGSSLSFSTYATASPTDGRSRLWPASMDPFMRAPPNGDLPLEAAFAAEWALPQRSAFIGDAVEVWDSKLLNDPDNLYDCIRSLALTPPAVDLRLRGRKSGCHESFNFKIDLTPLLSRGVTCTRPRSEPAYRGSIQREAVSAIAGMSHGRSPTPREREIWAAFGVWRDERGLPPWSDPAAYDDFWMAYNGEGPAAGEMESHLGGDEADGLREWCDAYCADQGVLKSFELERVVWGWDVSALRSTLTRVIKENALKSYPPLPGTHPAESADAARVRLPALPHVGADPLLVPGPHGVHYLAGRREGEWLNKWQQRIVDAVHAETTGRLCAGATSGRELDGYDASFRPHRVSSISFWDQILREFR